MKHVYSTFLLLLLLSVTTVAQAQITITESYFQDRIGVTETSTLFDIVDPMLDIFRFVESQAGLSFQIDFDERLLLVHTA